MVCLQAQVLGAHRLFIFKKKDAYMHKKQLFYNFYS